MIKLHENIRSLILRVVDLFYPIFKNIMPLQTFRYAACGGFNTVLDISLFFVSYNFILHRQPVSAPIDIHYLTAARLALLCFIP